MTEPRSIILTSDRVDPDTIRGPLIAGQRRPGLAFCAAILCAMLLAGLVPGTLEAATFNVTKTADTNDGNCDADCSLREAIIAANALSGSDIVSVPSGRYVLGILGTDEDDAAEGDLDITDTLTLNGAGAGSTIIDGNGIDRVFHVLPGPTVTLSGITIRDGDAGGDQGGGIYLKDAGTTTLTDVILTSNGSGDEGGGIYAEKSNVNFAGGSITGNNAGTRGGGIRIKEAIVNLVEVMLDGNSAGLEGGGIYSEKGTLAIERATLSGNSSTDGGGMYVKDGSPTLTNVTVSGNTATNNGGGIIHLKDTLTLNNVTFSDNAASGSGGGIRRDGGTVNLMNTIVANSPTGGDCSGAMVDGGNNLDSDGTCIVTLTAAPLLGLLANNGGPTQTHALLAGSPAIDAGTNAGCPATDQRGVSRPVDGDGDASAICDIGAYEAPLFNAANLALTMSDAVDPVSVGNPLSYTLTMTNNGPSDASNVTVVDALPADVDWQTATPSQGSCVHSGEPLGGTVTCTLGTVANGASATIGIEVVAPLTPATITNSATVSADEPDPDANDNTADEDTTIIDPSANLRVTQVEDFDPAGVNLPFTYTITVANQGPADATVVTLVDTLPGTVTFQTATPSQGSCSETGGVVTCDLGALINGATATVDITVTAPATPQTLSNTAVVSAAEPDGDLNDNTSVEDTTVINPPPTDLALAIIDTPDPVVGGGALSYTLTVDNEGPGPATQVQLTDTLPAGVSFVSATPTQGSCAEAGGVVTCDLGTLASDASTDVVIVVTAPAVPGVITNSASVTTNRIDPNSANDTATADTTVTVVDEADLALSKTDSPDPVLVNRTLSYSLDVTNLGPDQATDVVLVDTLPATVTFQSAVTSQGACAHSGGSPGGTVTCTLGAIPSGSIAMVDIIVTAPPNAGVITNNASVSASSDDSNPANDAVSEQTTVEDIHVNQLCYLVADAGGGGGGNDRLTSIDTADFDPLTNETNIGIGTGTNSIEAIAWNSAAGVLYGANANRLGTLSTTTGVFTPLPQTFGTGNGSLGNITFADVDGLSYDATSGVLYGVSARSGTDVLLQIDMVTGAHVPNAFGAGVDYVALQPILGNNITDDIAVDPTTGVMYASVNSGGSSDRLIRINKATGATTDIALITVPDIEGLGTDASGQLWGTSGTQNILYEINKLTGVGSNGRPLDNGSDYESVDCYAFSPSVIADLAVSKSVDEPGPPEGATVTYTVSASNAGPGIATVVQLSDVLPSGITLVSAAPSQGTYDSMDGTWFVGTLAAGNNAVLNIQASVDSGTVGSTITNTASVAFLSQIDPNAANDSASADIVPVGANLTVLKSVITARDPLGATAPAALAIPGAVVQYEISATNSGNGIATEVIVTDTLNSNLTFLPGEYNGGAADIEIIVGGAAPVYCVAEIGGDANADGCFLNASGDGLSVSIPISGAYPDGLTVGTAAPNNVVVVRFRATVN
ncbi:MAG: choice-of-anchor Q domain-containing protein [Gammaproteobacteria bacterium]